MTLIKLTSAAHKATVTSGAHDLCSTSIPFLSIIDTMAIFPLPACWSADTLLFHFRTAPSWRGSRKQPELTDLIPGKETVPISLGASTRAAEHDWEKKQQEQAWNLTYTHCTWLEEPLEVDDSCSVMLLPDPEQAWNPWLSYTLFPWCLGSVFPTHFWTISHVMC